jgi:hypothetical protein
VGEGRVAVWTDNPTWDPGGPEPLDDDPLSLDDAGREALAQQAGWTRQYTDEVIERSRPAGPTRESDT